MNYDISPAENYIKNIYYRYQQYLAPVITVAVCLVLFFAFIIPQLQTWFTTREQIVQKRDKVSLLQGNLHTIANINDATVAQQFHLVTKALPVEKDFSGILHAIAQAGSLSGIAIGDYDFSVGILNQDTTKVDNKVLQMQLTTKGDIDTTLRFLTALKQQLPLSNVTVVKFDNGNSGSMSISFYDKPLPKIISNDTQAISSLTSQEQQTLQQLTAWDNQ